MTITASIIGQTFITVMMDGKTITVNDDHVNYSSIREALRLKDHDQVEKLINVKASVINFVKGKVRIDDNKVFYGDMEVGGPVVNRILAMVRENFDSQPMLNFLSNLMENPSRRAVNELYGFLEESELPITEDGCFLAYKKVNNNYRDFYSGSFDNSVGTVVKMVRNQVDEDKDTTCSYGLHFCSLSYLPHYHGGQGKVMIVKINPRDVVSIPSDYNNAKGRCCEYVVVGEHAAGEETYAFTSPLYRDADPVILNIGGEETDYASEFDKGYDAGLEAASRDTDLKQSYNESAVGDFSNDYIEGYASGYFNNYSIDWTQEGYDAGDQDATDGDLYKDEPRVNLSDEETAEYKEGYAEGWKDSKINSL